MHPQGAARAVLAHKRLAGGREAEGEPPAVRRPGHSSVLPNDAGLSRSRGLSLAQAPALPRYAEPTASLQFPTQERTRFSPAEITEQEAPWVSLSGSS